MESNKNVSEFVKHYRRENGKSLNEMAKLCDVSRGTLENVERCESNITLETLDTIAKHIGVPPIALIAGLGKRYQEYDLVLKLVRKYFDLPSEKQASVADAFKLIMEEIGGENNERN